MVRTPTSSRLRPPVLRAHGVPEQRALVSSGFVDLRAQGQQQSHFRVDGTFPSELAGNAALPSS
eukprot:15433459-Alexandrium_andersonii.AAC.1